MLAPADDRKAPADGRWPELRLIYGPPLIDGVRYVIHDNFVKGVDLVAMGGVTGVVQLLDNFDIGLVQAAHDRRIIRVINGSWPDNARARAARMAQKFPEFTVDLSVLND